MKKEYIHFSINPDWEYIRIFRDFINSILSVKINNKNKAYDISFVVSELFENSVKFLSDGNILIKIKFVNNNKIEIQYKNKISGENRESLIAEINKFSNNSPEKILEEKIKDDPFWKKSRGELGFVMIHERILGKINLSFRESSAIVKCTLSLK